MAEERILMDAAAIGRTLVRLSHEVVEKNKGTDGLCLIGVKRRGEIVARRIAGLIKKGYGAEIPCAGIGSVLRWTAKKSCFATTFCIRAERCARR